MKAVRLSGAGSRAALCLATGAAPLADPAERAGARHIRRRGLLSVVRRFAGFGICRARGVAAWRGAGAARDPGMRAFVGPAKRASRARGLVLGRQPPAAFGIVAGVDGAAAGARGQCRCRHHGRNLQPDLCRLARRTAGGGRLHQRLQRRAGRPRSRRGCSERPEVEAILPGGRADTQIDGAPIEVLGPARSRHLSRSLAAAAIAAERLGPASPRRCRLRQRTIGAAPETCDRRPDRDRRAGRKLDARGGRHLCRLRQSEGPDCRQFRRPDPAFSGHPANAIRPARRARPRFRR